MGCGTLGDMRGASYSSFGGPITVGELAEPVADAAGAVIEVRATGICRSDWHGWQGHDADISVFPHVPGHEFAGVVVDVGADVARWRPGDRVAVPFIAGCGTCVFCLAGEAQVCPDQTQPGFTHWGSFAERVAVHHADFNLVALPDSVDFDTGAALGCRFTTAYRAVVDQGRAGSGDIVAVYGCGGVGISAIMIAEALGARAVGIDPRPEARRIATDAGAAAVFDPSEAHDGLLLLDPYGPHVTIDAVGSPRVVADAVSVVRRGGRHVQVGLLPQPSAFGDVTAGRVVAHEIAIIGSHGIAPAGLEGVLGLVASGDLQPDRLIGERVALADGVDVLTRLETEPALGMTVITEF